MILWAILKGLIDALWNRGWYWSLFQLGLWLHQAYWHYQTAKQVYIHFLEPPTRLLESYFSSDGRKR